MFENIVSKFGDHLLEMYNEETATPRKLVFSVFLYNLVKAARIIYGENTRFSKDFERLKEDLLTVFTLGAAFSTDYCDLRFYSLAGLSEMMLCSQLLTKDQVCIIKY